jgi:hypothetical protein
VLKRAVTLVAVNVVVLLVLAEATGLAIYYWQHGWMFYLTPYRQQFRDAVEAPGGGDSRAFDVRLSPYFGPAHRAGLPVETPVAMRTAADGSVVPDGSAGLTTNNFGFVAAHDYPYAKQSDREFVVGIFGGSVAAWFCRLGAPPFLRQLGERPFFRGKTLVPLCFAREGYKQPQQALLLTYFLSLGQAFDLVVNIDGFNEVALSRVNDEHGADLSMPSTMHLDGLKSLIDAGATTPEKLASLTAIEGHRKRLGRVARWLNATSFAGVFVPLERYHRVVEARYRAERARFAALPAATGDRSFVGVTPPLPRGQVALADAVAQLWVRSSRQMRDALTGQGIAYVHVLQPNQYATARRFSDAEAAVARNPASPFKLGAEQGYPRLLEALHARPPTERIFDGTAIFDSEAAPVYVDDCCHYTLRGNQLLAAFVARAVVTAHPGW